MTEAYHDKPYLDLVEDVLKNGVIKQNRTGVDTLAVFARQMRFDLSDGTIPLLTTKKMHIKSVIHEILWYLQGSDNTEYLNDNGVTIWDEWADEEGNLGPVYGYQWRKWPVYKGTRITIVDGVKVNEPLVKTIDQINEVIDRIKRDPNDRRLIVSAWNVGQLEQMALPPCHYAFQFYVENGQLSCMLNQRSCDIFLGVPFNVAQYSILTHMIAYICDLSPGEFIWSGGDVHIYENHFEQCKLQLTREPYPSPTLEFRRKKIHDIDDFKYKDFKIVDYKHHPLIKGSVAI